MSTESYAIRLDFPPSVNTYWRRGPKGQYLSKQGRAFKEHVKERIAQEFGQVDLLQGRLGVYLELCRGDRRQYDTDNYTKGVADALEGLLFENDGQIDLWHVKRGPVSPPGHCDVIISELGASDAD